ncbi:MAG TPA: histidine phosphatase family protein [Bacillota bacterium]
MGCELVLIRHGLTDWNDAGRLQGHTDIPLNDIGRQQATAVAAELRRRRKQVDAVYSSHLARAAATATIIAAAYGLTARIDARLRERALGVAEGLTWPELQARFGEPDGSVNLDALPGVEPRSAVIERVDAALRDIAQRHRQATVVIVGHGSALGNWLQARFGFEERPRLPNGGIVVVHDFPARAQVQHW